MKHSHTPGPWSTDSKNLGAVYCDDMTGSIVAKTAGSGFEYAKRPVDEVKANAQLVAAAPELLKALKAVTDHYCELVESGDCGFWNSEKEVEVLLARSAIVKAEGEE